MVEEWRPASNLLREIHREFYTTKTHGWDKADALQVHMLYCLKSDYENPPKIRVIFPELSDIKNANPNTTLNPIYQCLACGKSIRDY